jgi:hypothetical protein
MNEFDLEYNHKRLERCFMSSVWITIAILSLIRALGLKKKWAEKSFGRNTSQIRKLLILREREKQKYEE